MLTSLFFLKNVFLILHVTGQETFSQLELVGNYLTLVKPNNNKNKKRNTYLAYFHILVSKFVSFCSLAYFFPGFFSFISLLQFFVVAKRLPT